MEKSLKGVVELLERDGDVVIILLGMVMIWVVDVMFNG